jgi:hypothetical protein
MCPRTLYDNKYRKTNAAMIMILLCSKDFPAAAKFKVSSYNPGMASQLQEQENILRY